MFSVVSHGLTSYRDLAWFSVFSVVYGVIGWLIVVNTVFRVNYRGLDIV